MANGFKFIKDTDFINYTILSTTSEAAGFPASNIKSPEKRNEKWKSASIATDQSIIMDLWTAIPTLKIALIDVNFTTVRIQGSTTSVFTTIDFDSGNLSIGKDDFTETRRLIFMPASFGFRFLRILIPAQSTTDGDTGFTIAGVVVSSTITTMAVNPSYGFSISRIEPKVLIDMLSGRYEQISLNRVSSIEMDIAVEVDRTAESEFINTIDFLNHKGNLLIIPDGDLIERAQNNQFVWLVNRVTNYDYTIETFGSASVRGVRYKERV